MNGAAALEDVDLEFPVDANRGVDPQRRRRGLVTRRLGSTQEYEALASNGAHLQPTNLLLPSLGEPGDDGARRIGFDELFGDPETFCGQLGLNPDQLPLVEAAVQQPGKMRSARRADNDDLTARGDDLPQCRAQQTPLKDVGLGGEDFGDRPA